MGVSLVYPTNLLCLPFPFGTSRLLPVLMLLVGDILFLTMFLILSNRPLPCIVACWLCNVPISFLLSLVSLVDLFGSGVLFIFLPLALPPILQAVFVNCNVGNFVVIGVQQGVKLIRLFDSLLDWATIFEFIVYWDGSI